MKINLRFLIMAACIMMLCGCKDKDREIGAPINIRIYGVSGKADLQQGLKIGLFVDEPVGVDNARISVHDIGLVQPDQDLNWKHDQAESARFLAYAPYDPSYTGQRSVTYNAPTDQSTVDNMLQGNLLMGVSSGGPGDKAVIVKLKHAMTAMSISFDNRSGSRIESLQVSGFMTEGKLDFLTGTLSATGGKSLITPLRSPSDDNAFSFIYIPQDVTPVFQLKLASGKEIDFTYDNYCHEYPGSIVNMKIQIDESTPEANILQLNGVNISQWNTNGAPSFTQLPNYICLDGLKKVEPDPEDGFFSAYLNKVTVTAVDRTADDVLGVILEDSTKAIHVWTYFDSPLEVGSTIVGPVLGMMDKPNKDEVNISYFYTSYATIGKAKELPVTEGSFKNLSKKIKDWEYRRMVFKGATVYEEFNNDRAVFLQDGYRMSVVCPGIDMTLTEGTRGNLIGFPVHTGQDITIMVYDQDLFYSFTKDAVDNAVTRQSEYGLYDFSSRDTAVYVMTGDDMELQHSVRIYSYGRSMQVADTRNGQVHTFLVYDCPDKPVSGHEYSVAFNVMGASAGKGMTMNMECVKVDENTAWFVDRTNGDYGLVLAL